MKAPALIALLLGILLADPVAAQTGVASGMSVTSTQGTNPLSTWMTPAGIAAALGYTPINPANGIDTALPGGNRVGRFYPPRSTSVPVNSGVSSANRLWVAPVYVPNNATLKSLSFNIGTGNASAWNARLCVFADTGAGLPGAKAVDSGTVAIASGSVTGIQTVSLNSGAGVALTAGTYWVGMMTDSASESVFAFNNAGAYLLTATQTGFGSASALFTNGSSPGYWMAQTLSSGCPTPFSASPTDSAGQVVPVVAMGY